MESGIITSSCGSAYGRIMERKVEGPGTDVRERGVAGAAVKKNNVTSCRNLNVIAYFIGRTMVLALYSPWPS